MYARFHGAQAGKRGADTEVMVARIYASSLNRTGWRRRAVTVGSAITMLLVCISFESTGIASASSPTWTQPLIIGGSLSEQHGASIRTVSCSALGDCTAAGSFYLAPGGPGSPSRGFVVTESSGQ